MAAVSTLVNPLAARPIDPSKRRLLAALAAVAVLAMVESPAGAEDVSVPVELQVALLGRIVRYERTYMAQSTPARVLVVTRSGDLQSARAAAEFIARLRREERLGSREITVSAQEFTSARSLAALVERERIGIVYLAPGLGREMGSIASALSGQNVLTVAANGGDVARGAVLGFELVSSRPRIAVNLTRARSQRLRFNSQFLRIARVVE